MGMPIENQRVKDVINYFCDGNELQFSKDIGVSQPRINRLFSIDSRNDKYPAVTLDILQAIINKFIKINVEWLFTGKGDMIKTDLGYVNEPTEVYNVKENNDRITFLEDQVKFYKDKSSFYENLKQLESRILNLEAFLKDERVTDMIKEIHHVVLSNEIYKTIEEGMKDSVVAPTKKTRTTTKA